jgi:uncharacterized membrane protein YcaP (DUF421 family)
LEIVFRGSLVYLGILTLMRLMLKRVAGTLGIADLLMVVLLAEAAQNAMAPNYTTLTEGFVLVSTIVFWNYALEWLGYRIPAIQRWLHPPPLLLVKDGVIQWGNLKQELVTREELMSQLREQNVSSLEEVKEAHMEGDGQISAVTAQSPNPSESQPAPSG